MNAWRMARASRDLDSKHEQHAEWSGVHAKEPETIRSWIVNDPATKAGCWKRKEPIAHTFVANGSRIAIAIRLPS